MTGILVPLLPPCKWPSFSVLCGGCSHWILYSNTDGNRPRALESQTWDFYFTRLTLGKLVNFGEFGRKSKIPSYLGQFWTVNKTKHAKNLTQQIMKGLASSLIFSPLQPPTSPTLQMGIQFQRSQIVNLKELLEPILKFRFLLLLRNLPLGSLSQTPMWVAKSYIKL